MEKTEEAEKFYRDINSLPKDECPELGEIDQNWIEQLAVFASQKISERTNEILGILDKEYNDLQRIKEAESDTTYKLEYNAKQITILELKTLIIALDGDKTNGK